MRLATSQRLTGCWLRDLIARAPASRWVVGMAWALLMAMPCSPQTGYRWLIVAGEDSASEHLCWVPNNSSTLTVVPGKQDDCWARILRARTIELDGPRSQGIAELCSIAARALGKPVDQCLVPTVQSTFTMAPEPAGGTTQTSPDVRQILKKVAETYTSAKDYELVEEMTDDKGVVTRVRDVFKAPDRYRMEAAGPGFDFLLDSNAVGESVVVFDGSGAWFYLPESKQYFFMPVELMVGNDREDLRPEATDQYTMWHFRRAEDLIGKAKFLREEMAEFAGAKVNCYVLSVSDLGSDTWWIDTKGYRVVRQAYKGTTTVFTTIRLNEPLSDELFQFTPPPGAKKIDR